MGSAGAFAATKPCAACARWWTRDTWQPKLRGGGCQSSPMGAALGVWPHVESFLKNQATACTELIGEVYPTACKSCSIGSSGDNYRWERFLNQATWPLNIVVARQKPVHCASANEQRANSLPLHGGGHVEASTPQSSSTRRPPLWGGKPKPPKIPVALFRSSSWCRQTDVWPTG
jgi:hypothetical protein